MKLSLFSLVTLASYLHLTSAAENKIPEWLPGCFDDSSSNFFGLFSCLKNNASPQCFDSSSAQDIVDCVIDDLPEFDITKIGSYMRLFFNATRNCLDPYVDCVKETIEERLENLEPCLNTTLVNLKECATTHALECQENCTNAVPDTNPFEDLNKAKLATCNGLQEEIVDPTCAVMDCCQPCVEPLEELMECVVNDVLDLTVLDCNFTCPDASNDSPNLRQLTAATKHSKHYDAARSLSVATDGEPVDLESCLQFSPGLTGQDASELEVRSAIFMPCVYQEYVNVIDQQAEQQKEEQKQQQQQQQGNQQQPQNGTSSGYHVSAVHALMTMVLLAAVALL